MKRSLLLGLATLATAATTMTSVPAAQADTTAHAQVQLASSVSTQIARVDAALTRIEGSAAVQKLDADVRAEVRANINADQADLADLSVEVSSADTISELKDLRDAVLDYRVVVYTQAVAALHAADQLADKVEDFTATIDLKATILALLGSVETSLDATVDGAVELDATSSNGDVREVRADLHAATKAYAAARR
jgi:hypothetical protein